MGSTNGPQLPERVAGEIRPPPFGRALETRKAPASGAFDTCAEEDSNLHPVIPDQALNLARQVSYASRSCSSVQIVHGSGRVGMR